MSASPDTPAGCCRRCGESLHMSLVGVTHCRHCERLAADEALIVTRAQLARLHEDIDTRELVRAD